MPIQERVSMTVAAEHERLAALASYEVLDTPAEQGFDDLVRLAAAACSTPISAVSLIDSDRQWFKAQVGLGDLTETSRSEAFCRFTMLGDDLMVVPDARLDPRFAGHPGVIGEPGIRFYAGAPLVSPEGQPLGALCVLDTSPRELSDEQAEALRLLGRQVSAQLALRRTVHHLSVSEHRFRTVFDQAPIGMAVVSLATEGLGALVEVNAELEAMLRYPPGALIGRCLTGLVDPLDSPAMLAHPGDAASEGGAGGGYRQECRIRTAAGDWVLAQVSGASVEGEASTGPRMVLQVEDVTSARRAQEALAYAATRDALTGLANRTWVLAHLRAALTRAGTATDRTPTLGRSTPGRSSPGHVGVLFVDLDRFKVVNDSLGHAAGDEVLVVAARRIENVVRSGDVVARLGGDEFVVVAEDLGPTAGVARERAEQLAGRIVDELGRPIPLGRTETFVGASVGIALSGDDAQSAEDIIRNADAAMYAAKRRGKGTTAMFDTGLRSVMAERHSLDAGLHRALERHELELYYQPVIDLATGLLVGAEALLRWHHPERGLLTPDAFIAVAEETGLIVPIGAWALQRACRDVAEARTQTGTKVTVAVNVAPRQLDDGHLADTVTAALDASGLDPTALHLEVTETALFDMAGPACDQLESLRRLGVSLGIDDFGTGYASLTYLRDLPADFIKIDRSFVAGLGTSRSETAIIAAVLNLAADMDLHVVAEGVETTDQAERLAGMGCTYGQGYLWSRPLPPEALRRSKKVTQLLPPGRSGPPSHAKDRRRLRAVEG